MQYSTYDQTTKILNSISKVFVSTLIAQILTTGTGVLDLSTSSWKACLNAGVSAALVVTYNYLNTDDSRYGRGYVTK